MKDPEPDVPDVPDAQFVVTLTYGVKARSRGEAMDLLVKYQSDSLFMHEQDLRKHRGSQVVDLLDCEVLPPDAPPSPPTSDVDAATKAFVASAIEWREHVALHAGHPLTQAMLDKLDSLVILRSPGPKP